ncbi:MAG: hypothetical protein NTZ69_02650 [Bacteroidia bacterium]|nr:hypothetical protein [Bacteroidia bacterium]
MDKKIWLRVIREELELLDVLATGMIEDKKLSKEEVELAISRSKIVAKEFEMLLNQIAAPIHQEEKIAEVEIPAKAAEEEIIFQMTIPEYNIAEIEPELPSEEPIDEPLIQIEESPASQSPGPLVSESPGLSVTESLRPSVPSSPGLLVSKSPSSPFGYAQGPAHPPVSPSPPPFQIAHDTDVHSILNMETKSEENSRFKPTPIKSLKEGLILNDRYLFQRELFNNDKAKLDGTVAALDRLANIHEAVEYLKANFRWTKSEASEKFVQLVKRRFSETKG